MVLLANCHKAYGPRWNRKTRVVHGGVAGIGHCFNFEVSVRGVVLRDHTSSLIDPSDISKQRMKMEAEVAGRYTGFFLQ